MRSLRDLPGFVVVIAEWEVANAKCIFFVFFHMGSYPNQAEKMVAVTSYLRRRNVRRCVTRWYVTSD